VPGEDNGLSADVTVVVDSILMGREIIECLGGDFWLSEELGLFTVGSAKGKRGD
jgi:hypothetical protein